MRKACLAIAALAAALFTPAASAQQQWTFDAGVFGRVNWLDGSYQTNTGFGGGGRVGVFVLPHLELEFDASYSSNSGKSGSPLGSLDYVPYTVRAEYFYPLQKEWSVMGGIGFADENFSNGLSAANTALALVVGARKQFGANLYALVDFTANYAKVAANPDPSVSSSWNTGLEFGVGWLFDIKKKEAAPTPAPAPAPPPAPVAAAPAAAAVIAAPAPPPDDDNDGVPNATDACPNTPPREAVDANGCSASQRDSDHDGVKDFADKCPDTPPNTPVDASGCPIKPLVLEGVTFETNKAVLAPSSDATLDTVADGLIAHPTVKIEIAGYTDNSGNASKNVQLSQSRADAVKAYLVSKGVAADRMVAKGYGPADPIASNATPEGRAQNRRVAIKVTSE